MYVFLVRGVLLAEKNEREFVNLLWLIRYAVRLLPFKSSIPPPKKKKRKLGAVFDVVVLISITIHGPSNKWRISRHYHLTFKLLVINPVNWDLWMKRQWVDLGLIMVVVWTSAFFLWHFVLACHLGHDLNHIS